MKAHRSVMLQYSGLGPWVASMAHSFVISYAVPADNESAFKAATEYRKRSSMPQDIGGKRIERGFIIGSIKTFKRA